MKLLSTEKIQAKKYKEIFPSQTVGRVLNAT